jgi:S1-C subfamily serine protease
MILAAGARLGAYEIPLVRRSRRRLSERFYTGGVGRLLVLTAALVAFVAPAPQTVVLRISVTVTAADGSTRPVPRHALLISDDPVTMAPQRFVTRNDGIAEAHLKPGKYIVESDVPFLFEGKAYEWAQPVTVAQTGDTTLALTARNAAVEAKPGSADSPGIAEAAAEHAEASLLAEWQDSVVTIWTPRTSGRGFLVDPRGLIATNQRLVGRDTAVEVQFSETKKVAGRVVASDANKNVAIIWIDPQAAAPAKSMTLAYGDGDKAGVSERDKVYSIEGRTGEAKDLVSGTVERVSAHTVASDVPLGRDSSGAPIFTAAGAVVAIATADDATVINTLSPRAVRIDDVRAAMAEAEKKLQGATPPAASLLPVDPVRPFPEDALKRAAKTRGSATTAYLVAASEFDLNVITPPMVYASMHRQEDEKHFDYARDDSSRGQQVFRPLDDFGGWSEYVSEAPPVVLVRVTPKFGENFWTTVARGAAQTQGVAIPAIKRPKAAFGGLRLTCGDKEVAPVHPFRIEHRLDDTASIDEGLYAFEASAFSPQCGSVKITVFSDKPQDKGDTRTLDAKIVQQVWDDFAPYRQ